MKQYTKHLSAIIIFYLILLCPDTANNNRVNKIRAINRPWTKRKS